MTTRDHIRAFCMALSEEPFFVILSLIMALAAGFWIGRATASQPKVVKELPPLSMTITVESPKQLHEVMAAMKPAYRQYGLPGLGE